MKLVQFGGGNIGRSFIGQIFNSHGYEVVFIDLNQDLVSLLNTHGGYRVVVKQSNQADRIIEVKGIRAVDARDSTAVASELTEADLAATSVGGNALPHLVPSLTKGLLERRKRHGDRPLDLILAENIRDGAALMRKYLGSALPEAYPLERLVGLVETSIGKMVPIMPRQSLAIDPLWVFAEPYNTLILDHRGFRGKPPEFPEIKLVDNITAYVDRKLFIHNLGHAAAAYLGYQHDPQLIHIWQTLEIPEVLQKTRQAMSEAAAGVAAEYPESLSPASLADHIEDLLSRFRNRALGDTIYRVGLDLRRKLGRHDRIIGAILLNQKHDLPCRAIIDVLLAAFQFRATGENGLMFPADSELIAGELDQGLETVLEKVCGLSRDHDRDRRVIEHITRAV